MSTNGNIFKYYVKLLMRDIPEPFIYEVGIEQVERWQRRLERIPEKESQEPIPWLFCFDTANGLTIGVCVAEVQLAHFLFERASDQHITPNLGAADPERSDVHLYFRNRAQPYAISVAEAANAFSLYFQLELGTFEPSEFFSLLDVDGEEIALRLQDVVLAEFKQEVLDEGREEIDGASTE